MYYLSLSRMLMAGSLIFFYGCSEDAPTKTKTTTLALSLSQVTKKILRCDADTYSLLQAEDTIRSLSDDTKLKIIHHQDGTKEACVLSGDARIE